MSTSNQITDNSEQWRQFSAAVLSDLEANENLLKIDSQNTDLFIKFLYKNGIESLLLDRLQRHDCEQLVSNEIINSLSSIRRNAHVKEVYRKKHLQDVLQLFDENKIKSLILKGTSFAYSLYQRPYQRSRVDTDILINIDDKERLDQLLIDSGFSKSLNISGRLISHQTTFCQNQKGIKHAYDIHWKISNRNAYTDRFKFDELSVNKVNIGGLSDSAYRLGNIDAFLHATVHYFGHYSHERDRLVWIYDIHLLCCQFTRHDWELLLEQSYDKKLDPLCNQILNICRQTFNTDIPVYIFESLDHSKNQIAKIEQNRIYNEKWTRLDQFKSDWVALGFSQRCQLVREYLIPPIEFVLEQNKSSNKFLLPYFYIKRIIIGGIRILSKKKKINLT